MELLCQQWNLLEWFHSNGIVFHSCMNSKQTQRNELFVISNGFFLHREKKLLWPVGKRRRRKTIKMLNAVDFHFERWTTKRNQTHTDTTQSQHKQYIMTFTLNGRNYSHFLSLFLYSVSFTSPSLFLLLFARNKFQELYELMDPIIELSILLSHS